MRALVVVLLLAAGCGDGDFLPPRPDLRQSIDLAAGTINPAADLSCPNQACGGCSSWLKWDGTAAAVGDPCAWKGTWQCSGTTLACSDTGCPTCGGTMTGSLCGADGHTVLELSNVSGSCSAYDFNAAIAVCNHGSGDHCVGRCTKSGTTYACVAHCASDDGGGTGCAWMAGQTCDSLTSC